jgi:outer membrane protein OmpU
MKKVLFATTALVLSAGFASADVSFSGNASAGIARDGNGGHGYAAGELYSYAEAELDIAFSGSTDNGLTFGASMDLNVGTGFDLGDDEFDVNTGEASLGSVYISGAMGTLTFDPNGIDDLYDDDNTHDISYSYSAGGLSFSATAEVAGGSTAPHSDVSVSVGYSMDGLSFTVTGNDANTSQGGTIIAIGYTVNDMLSLSLSHDMPADGSDDVTKIGANIDLGNGLTMGLSADTADDWDVSVGYTAGAISLAASTDEADAWEVTGAYALGGGASVVAGANAADSAHLGVAFSF